MLNIKFYIREKRLVINDNEYPDFEIEREIGSGANGRVFLAKNLLLDRYEAIKIWFKNCKYDKRDKAKQALLESQKLAKVDPEYAVQIFNAGFAKYNGKTVRFKGIVALDSSLPNGNYAIGRHIMTCCADDIAYRGVVAKGMGNLKLKTRDWVIVEGVIALEYSELYREEGPVLNVKKISPAKKPDQEVATF